ncbi:MAG: hypothetical protein ABFR05_10790 [Bacteroidota bacterium]
MKKIITLIAVLIFTFIAEAQIPEKMSYQAIIRNNAGELLTKQDIGVKIGILQGSASSEAVYVETHNRQTNENGLLSLELGDGEIVQGDFSSIDWSLGPYFLRVETDPTGGTTYSVSGVSQLLSVPYALYAKSSGSISGDAGHYVGELYGGGIIFFVYDNGRHGLIASLVDLDGGNEVSWGRVGANVDTNAWNGATNTSNIITAGVSYPHEAAGLCDAYASGGFEWYLPSIWELNYLFDNAAIISRVLYEDGDEVTQPLQLDRYWSSTSTGPSTATAFGLNLSEGLIIRVQKSGGSDNMMRVRAIRAF